MLKGGKEKMEHIYVRHSNTLRDVVIYKVCLAMPNLSND